MDLSAVPHFTTLQKFFCRIKTLYLRYAFGKTLNLFYSNADPIPVTAIDSSGSSPGSSLPKAGSMILGMRSGYSDNVTKYESQIVMLWIRDTILKQFIV